MSYRTDASRTAAQRFCRGYDELLPLSPVPHRPRQPVSDSRRRQLHLRRALSRNPRYSTPSKPLDDLCARHRWRAGERAWHETIIPVLRELANGGFQGPAIGDLDSRGKRLAEAGQALGITVEAIARGQDGQFIPSLVC
jgi:hypothetical protein